MKTKSIATLFSLAFLGSGMTFADTTATTDPVGFVSVTVPANSDAILAVPLNRTAVFKGVIQSISGTTLTVAGTSPAWTTNQFVQSLPTQVNTYAVLLATGTKEGMIAKVTANGGNTVTVQLATGDDLTGVKTETVDGAGLGDHIDIMPYWTPSTIFTGTVAQDTAILLFPTALAGTNLAASEFISYDSGNWYDGSFNVADNTPLSFGQAFVLRNAGASSMSISMVGSVPMASHRYLLRVLAGNTDQDLMIGYSSPVPEAIGNIGLGFTTDDLLLIFNNSSTGINKAASKLLYYSPADGGWVDGDDFSVVNNTFFLQPGQGYIFRKKAGASPSTIVWQHLQSYLN